MLTVTENKDDRRARVMIRDENRGEHVHRE